MIRSPCRKICAIDGLTDWCLGCGRTLQEIGDWLYTSEAEKAALIPRLRARMQRLTKGDPTS